MLISTRCAYVVSLIAACKPTLHALSQIINTLGHSPLLGDFLIASKGISDDRKLGADECAKLLQEGLDGHGIGVFCAPNVKIYDAAFNCKDNPGLLKQVISAVATDNCTTALATANKFVENVRASAVNTHGPKLAESAEVKPLRCISHAYDTTCGKGVLLRCTVEEETVVCISPHDTAFTACTSLQMLWRSHRWQKRYSKKRTRLRTAPHARIVITWKQSLAAKCAGCWTVMVRGGEITLRWPSR